MDVLKNMIEKDAQKEGITRIAEALVAMYVDIAQTPHLDRADKAFIARALDGVKFEIFPHECKTDEKGNAFVAIKNRYQAQRYIIQRVDKWLREKTSEPVEKIENVQTTLKYLHEIQ